jgi:hypothetical protein
MHRTPYTVLKMERLSAVRGRAGRRARRGPGSLLNALGGSRYRELVLSTHRLLLA